MSGDTGCKLLLCSGSDKRVSIKKNWLFERWREDFKISQRWWQNRRKEPKNDRGSTWKRNQIKHRCCYAAPQVRRIQSCIPHLGQAALWRDCEHSLKYALLCPLGEMVKPLLETEFHLTLPAMGINYCSFPGMSHSQSLQPLSTYVHRMNSLCLLFVFYLNWMHPDSPFWSSLI